MYKYKSALVLVTLIVAFLAFPKPAHANVFDDIVNGVKKFFIGGEPQLKKQLTVDSNISLAPDGDLNHNGQIDAGDIVRFAYNIKNNTDQTYAFATLKTNVDRKQINFIHNITGASSLDDNGKSVTIPNLRINPKQLVMISFDARVNYYTSEDPTLTTEAELLSKDNKSVIKSSKKELKAKRINKDKVPGILKFSTKDNS